MSNTRSSEYVQYGCGLCAPATWTNFDVSPTLRMQRVPGLAVLSRWFGPQFPANARYGDVVKGLPVARGSCAAIYCSHTLEHLALRDFEIALRHTFNYLRPGGVFRFVLPDLEALARDYLNSTDPSAAVTLMEASYLGVKERQRGVMGLLRAWMGNSQHLWMWDFKSMRQHLSRTGFVEIRRAQYGDSPDPHFKDVEELGRWEGHLGIECRKPG